jgi:hypothetical protein
MVDEEPGMSVEFAPGILESPQFREACAAITEAHEQIHADWLKRAEQWQSWDLTPRPLTWRERGARWVRDQRVRLAQWIAGDDWPAYD